MNRFLPDFQLGDEEDFTRQEYEALLLGAQGLPPEARVALPHEIDPLAVGARDSGSAVILPNGQRSGVLHARQEQDTQLGIAAVHVDVQDVAPFPPPDTNVQQKLILFVSWTTGRGSGEAQVDATRGSFFTVCGAHSVEIDAQLVSPDASGVVVPGSAKRVDIAVQWGAPSPGSICMFTGPRVLLAPNVESAPFFIPKQANSLIVETTSTVQADLNGLLVNFYWADFAGAALAYTRINPNANAAMVGAGVQFVRFKAAAAMTVTPFWELNLS